MISQLQRRVLSAIRRHDLISPGDRVLVAASGGLDSVCLLHLLHGMRRLLKVEVGVAHLNHRLRGEASDEDERFVEALCRGLKVPFHSRRSDVMKLARRRGISLEMAARDARRRFYGDTMHREGYAATATGHTADDQAETIIMRLARGTGTRGLGAIRHVSRQGRLRLIRPLRDVSRDALVQYALKEGLAWREDSSNSNRAFSRNRVRHDVLPVIRASLNPRFAEAACRAGDILAADEAWLEALSAQIIKQVQRARPQDAAVPALSVTALREHPVAAQRRVLRIWLSDAGVGAQHLNWDQVERMLDLLAPRRRSRRASLAGDWTAAREGDLLVLRRSEPTDPPAYRVPVPVPGECRVEAAGIRVVTWFAPTVVRDRTRQPGLLPARASVNPAMLGRRKLFVRTWRAGDRLRPLGIGGTRKLQDIFVDAKVDRSARARIPLLACGGCIVWVPGYRIAEEWAVAPGGPHALQILIEPIS
ncbi:MAG: tRNA lysidine(34) synthetase TilS [Verrucomicrobia bacterium]|nr:tRNA lysidine(34) synthetase TilS [Verrucomicrobiota bacterium]